MKQISDKTIKYIKNIGASGLINSLKYEDTSLWWFFEWHLNLLLNKYKCKTCKGHDPIFLKIRLMTKHNILIKLLPRYIISRAVYRSDDGCEGNKKILAISNAVNVSAYPSPNINKSKHRVDSRLFDIINMLNEHELKVVLIDEDSTSLLDLRNIFGKMRNNNITWRPIEFYLTYNIFNKSIAISRKFKDIWHDMEKTYKVSDSIVNNEKQFNTISKHYIKLVFLYGTLLHILYIELMKKAIEREDPNLILITCAYCRLGRAAIIAAKSIGVPTLEIQHGEISKSSIGYIYTDDEIEQNCPVPDKILVYGKYYKDLLINESAFDEENIVVTGQPRYDFMTENVKIYEKSKIRKKYKLNNYNKIVLWTTQCIAFTAKENIDNFKTVFKVISTMNNVCLIIKPHPKEGVVHKVLMHIYAKKYGCKVTIYPKNVDTYELISISDIVITKHSTTGLEAVALNKPLIILNLGGQPDVTNHVKEGVALGAYSEKELKSAINRLIIDDSYLKINRDNYISKYMLSVDGKATERVVKVIEDMIAP